MNRRRKLLMIMSGGISSEAKALFNTFKARVIADGGEVLNERFLLKFYDVVVKANAVSFCNTHAMIHFPDARRVVSGNKVNKIYSAFNENFDFMETEAAFQPTVASFKLNGKELISYFDGQGLNGGGVSANQNFTNGIGFLEMNGVFFSADETSGSINRFIFNSTSDTNAATVRGSLGYSSSGTAHNVDVRRLDSDSFVRASAAKTAGFNLISGRVGYDDGVLRLFRNTQLIDENTGLSAGTTNTISFYQAIGNNGPKSTNRCLNGLGAVAYQFNAEVPASLNDKLDKFFIREYQLPNLTVA